MTCANDRRSPPAGPAKPCRKRLVEMATLMSLVTLLYPTAAAERYVGQDLAPATSLSQYQERVEGWAGRMQEAQARAAGGDREWRRIVEQVRSEAGQTTSVERSAGGAVAVDHAWLEDRLGSALSAGSPHKRETMLQEAREALETYRVALGQARTQDPDHLRATLKKVLPRPKPARKLHLPEWLVQALERLARLLGRLFGRHLGRRPAAWLFWVIVGLLGALVAASLGLAARAIYRSLGRRGRERGVQVEIGLPWSPPDASGLVERARQAAAQGRYGEAIRHLYLAFLLQLDRLGSLRYHPATANWEYLRQLPETGLRGSFSTFTLIFDRKCYGGELAAASDYQECQTIFDMSLPEVGVG